MDYYWKEIIHPPVSNTLKKESLGLEMKREDPEEQ